MRTLLYASAAVLLVGCAHTHEEIRTTTAVGEPAPPLVEREILVVDTPPPTELPPPPPRPRLAQTITLGQGAEAQYAPTAPPPMPPSSGQGVVINNNIVVQSPPVFYGYGGYGSGYRYGGGYGRPALDGRTGGSSKPTWGATGWEGARRTAAPGQTPGVGGNWAPVPSYGPATMK